MEGHAEHIKQIGLIGNGAPLMGHVTADVLVVNSLSDLKGLEPEPIKLEDLKPFHYEARELLVAPKGSNRAARRKQERKAKKRRL